MDHVPYIYIIDGAPRPPTPPPGYARHDPMLVAQEINHRPNVIAEGRTAANLDPDLERNRPIPTGGLWSQYVQRIAEEMYSRLR